MSIQKDLNKYLLYVRKNDVPKKDALRFVLTYLFVNGVKSDVVALIDDEYEEEPAKKPQEEKKVEWADSGAEDIDTFNNETYIPYSTTETYGESTIPTSSG